MSNKTFEHTFVLHTDGATTSLLEVLLATKKYTFSPECGIVLIKKYYMESVRKLSNNRQLCCL